MTLARAAVLALALVSIARAASAAPTAQERAVAESLFREGKDLAAAGSLAAACAKFEESQRLDPQLGTLLHLATCHQELGMTASAWIELEEAASLAQRAGDAREAIARQRAAKLEGKLSYLVIDVEAPAGVEVTLDGKVLGQASFGTPIPVDPREHALSASAPGHKPWSRTLTIPEGPHHERVTIPALAGAPSAAPPSSAAPSDATPAHAIAGYVVGGVGLVSLGVGSAFGIIAKSQADEADDKHCEGQFCTAEGLDLHDSANDSALVSTILFAVGAPALATGIVLVITAPSAEDEAHLWVKPAFGPRAGLVTAGGRW